MKPFRCHFALAGAILLLAAAPRRAHAAFQFTLTQTGGNVVVNGSGTLNTTALTLASSTYAGQGSTLFPTGGIVAVDPGSVNVMEYSGISGPASSGGGGFTTPTTSSGYAVVISGSVGLLFVPQGYVSGTAISDTMTFTGATFATLGFTPGTYTYTWGTGAGADSLTVTSVVPEPSTWALLGFGVAGAGVVALRRRRARA